jgi:hypothetical protein
MVFLRTVAIRRIRRLGLETVIYAAETVSKLNQPVLG